MLYLHVSNRTENLLKHLTEVIRIGGDRDLFSEECFVIQSQGMERMISQTLAKEFTSWCNFHYYLPITFLQHIAQQLGMQITPDGFDRQIMIWRIEQLLRSVRDKEFTELQGYLDGAMVEVKRFQLAEQLANVFDQYQLMRPEMLAGWEQGRLTTDKPVEIWQKALWQKLASQMPDTAHRGVVLGRVIEKLTTTEPGSLHLPGRISVFGLSIMPPLFLSYLQGLALHADVHLYVLSPCREYWGDIESRRKLLKTDELSGDFLHNKEEMASHPLLVSLGLQGRDFQRMLFDDAIFELDFSSYEEPLNESKPTLLQQLQSDMLSGRLTSYDSSRGVGDPSLTVVSCHSKLRELQIVKQYILRLLNENPTIQLRDIVVMAPDVQEYGPLISAVFADIQHSISDRSLRHRNRLLSGFLDFLLLFSGRFGWDELLDLLNVPAIAQNFGLQQTDLENIHSWVVESGIRWGLSEKQRAEVVQPAFSEGSWQAGLERMLMGYAINSDELVDNILPFTEIEGNNAEPLGGLCQFISLLERARLNFKNSYPLKKWSQQLLSFARELFVENSEKDVSREFLELQELLVDLAEGGGKFHSSEVSFDVICRWFEHSAKETRSSSGFLRGQLTFCSMLPMRSIPFNVVCLLGLNEGAFPRNDRFSTFDLLKKEHRPGDRSKRMDDRYQFLEAILSARENLYISYVGQSQKNNEKIPPSVVVSELQDLLSTHYKVKKTVVHHPLHPFSPRYFNRDEEDIYSYDENYCRVAKKMSEPKTLQRGWWQGSLESDFKEISINELLNFYSNPQKWFVRRCLQVYPSTAPSVTEQSELFELDSLENYLIDQELLQHLLQKHDPQFFLKKLQLSGRFPLGKSGVMAYYEKVAALESFCEIIGRATGEREAEDVDVELQLGTIRLSGTLSNIYRDRVVLYRYSKLKGRDLIRGWLYQVLYQRALGHSIPTLVVAKDATVEFSGSCSLQPDLNELLNHYLEGNKRPSHLFMEPGGELLKKAPDEEKLFNAIRKNVSNSLDKGYEPELELLLRGDTLSSYLDEEFEQLCSAIFLPIWRAAHGN